MSHDITRRAFLLASLGCLAGTAAAQQCRRTPSDALGPFYVPGQPAQADLCQRDRGPGFTVSGRVLGYPECRPVADATIEVWHADQRGRYSLVGGAHVDDLACLLRGSVRSAQDGRYAVRTLVPGAYPGRPRHVHLRIAATGYRTLVTQMYMPRQDGVDPGLLAKLLRGTPEAPLAVEFDINIAPL